VKKFLCVLLVGICVTGGGIVAAQEKNQIIKGKPRMKIEVLYFDSCPSSKQAIANVKAAIKERQIQAELVLIKVETEEKAEKVGFQGSPSVRINGKDLEGRDEGFSFSCRLYRVRGKPATAPSIEQIRAKLAIMMK
jgi:hypothetical protein